MSVHETLVIVRTRITIFLKLSGLYKSIESRPLRYRTVEQNCSQEKSNNHGAELKHEKQQLKQRILPGVHVTTSRQI